MSAEQKPKEEQKEVPKDGKYGSSMVTEKGKVEAPPANTDQV